MATHLNQISQRESPAPLYRFRGHISPAEAERQGARAEAIASSDGETAVLRIYDVIDSWGGFWGISVNEVMTALDELGDASAIQVRINSPGGEATEGVALYNALNNHPARVDVFIDGLAASAASLWRWLVTPSRWLQDQN
jgi:ATP-dependent protease ClpP protease subunit